MFKILGSMMIIAASTGIGFMYSNDLKIRLKHLRTLKKIILMLRGEVKYSHTTIGEAFSNICNKVDNPFDIFLNHLVADLDEYNGQTFLEIWEQNVTVHLCNVKLKKTDTEELIALGENLGYLDKDMQLIIIDLYLENLEREIGESEKFLENNSRLYKSMGIMCGILVVLVIV